MPSPTGSRICLATLLAASFAIAQVPLQPFRIRIIREVGLGDVLNYNSCLIGKLYEVQSFSPPLPAGEWIADTVELPWRNDAAYVSSIPPGRYKGSIKTEPTSDGRRLGWRVELSPTVPRTAIQIHAGPLPIANEKNTEGCIIVGLRNNPDKLCWLEQSSLYRDKLKSRYGSDNSRPVEIEIVEEGVRRFTVPASNAGGLNTGLKVEIGNELKFSAFGNWCWGSSNCSGPAGFPGRPLPSELPVVMKGELLGTLIGQVGNWLFRIGPSATIKSQATGPLVLLFNDRVGDTWDKDNSGTMDGKVAIRPR